MKVYWKIAEVNKDGSFKTLFHGVKGSRKLPIGQWMESEKKLVSDGSGPVYWSGWHVLPSKAVAEKYITRFKTRVDRLVIIPCHIKGNRWPKAHANSPIILAQWIRLI